MNATLYTHDHIVHFYQLSALDWVDVVSSLSADPREVSELQKKISPHHPLSSPGYFRDVQNRLKKFVASGQLGIFANGYWGHPAMKLPPAVNLLAVTHYLEQDPYDFRRQKPASELLGRWCGLPDQHARYRRGRQHDQ